MKRKTPFTGLTNPTAALKPKVRAGREFDRPLARREFQQTGWERFSGVVLCSLLTCAVSAGHAQNASGPVSDPNQPDANAPWPEAEKKGNWPPAGTTKPVEAKPAATPQPVVTPPPTSAAPAMPLGPMAIPKPPSTTRHELALSADYLLGQGTVTLPLGSAISTVVPGFPQEVNDADRDSTYFGATYAYSLGQAWYVDIAYTQGDSSGDLAFDAGGGSTLNGPFSLEDKWYQAYLRYTFPQLRGQRFQAYLRAGVSFVQSDLTLDARNAAIAVNQQAETEELYGNLGLGMSYPLYRKGRFQIRFNADAEVFYGQRTTDLTESFTLLAPFFLTQSSKDSFDGAVYGGFAKGTVRFQYELTETGFLKAFLDGGAQVKYSQIDYPQGWFDELLWGPYVKAGLLYSF